MKRLLLSVVLVLLLPTVGHCFIDLFDIGLVNAQKASVVVVVEYNKGRSADIHLDPGKSLITRRGFGEHITKVTVRTTGQAARTYDLAELRKGATHNGHGGEWLYISGDRTRIISSEKKHQLEGGPKT